MPDNFRGISENYSQRRNIFGYHRTHTDDSPLADFNAWHYHNPNPDPDILADNYRFQINYIIERDCPGTAVAMLIGQDNAIIGNAGILTDK